MSPKLIIIIILVSLLLAGSIVGYRLFWVAPEAPAPLSGVSGITSGSLLATTASGEIDAEQTEYARLLKTIANIDSLETSIFAGNVFRSLFLHDFSVYTPNPGRGNPFAPAQ